MKHMTILFLALAMLPGIHRSYGQKPNPVPVIFDTDPGNDIDDVLALQMLINYQKDHKINLLGITISKAYERTIEYVDGYCRFNGINNIPLGYVYKGVTPDPGKYIHQTLDTLIHGNNIMKPGRTIKSDIPEAYKLLRKLLALQKDRSVVLIVVGPETNIARLLNSPADEYSNMNGIELVKKKVKLVSIMGGLYGDEFDFPEWNIKEDLESSKTVFEKCPVEIVASGWELGNKLLYPHQSILNDFKDSYKHPLCVSYKLYERMPYDRQTWDLTSVLYAIEPTEKHFELSERGLISIDSVGKSIFTPLKNGKHRYLKINNDTALKTLGVLVERVTGKSSRDN